MSTDDQPVTYEIPVDVHTALLGMMQDVRAIGKDGLYEQGSTRYKFRGVDAVVNAVGPVARKHGVVPRIVNIDREYIQGETKAGGKMQECRVLVTWELCGPGGDCLTVMSAGEAMDTSDKGTSKALSVARRNMWLDTLLIPTQDKDPDEDHIERGEAYRSAVSYRDELLDSRTSPSRLHQIGAELRSAGRFGEACTDADGETETTLGALGKQVIADRQVQG